MASKKFVCTCLLVLMCWSLSSAQRLLLGTEKGQKSDFRLDKPVSKPSLSQEATGSRSGGRGNYGSSTPCGSYGSPDNGGCSCNGDSSGNYGPPNCGPPNCGSPGFGGSCGSSCSGCVNQECCRTPCLCCSESGYNGCGSPYSSASPNTGGPGYSACGSEPCNGYGSHRSPSNQGSSEHAEKTDFVEPPIHHEKEDGRDKAAHP